MPSLVRQVVSTTTAVLLGTLVLTGLGTGAVLHHRTHEAVDRALLAAAHGRARPDAGGRWEVEDSTAPVETWLWAPGDRRVDPQLARETLEDEEPRFVDQGRWRLLLLLAEEEHEDEDDDDAPPRTADAPEHEHIVVVARAERVTLARSVGPFALAYGVVAALAASLAALVQGRLVHRAAQPLRHARETSARVVRLAQGTRLPVEGPDEVQGLMSDLNALLDRLDDAYGAQARFTAEAAHELRTPVTSLLGEIDVTLRRPRQAEEYRAALEAMRGDVERLRALVEALMVLARLDAGQLDAGREAVLVSEIVHLALRSEAETLRRAGCALAVEPGVDRELRAHPALLSAALANLLRNAAAHAPGRPVRLSVRAQGERVELVVDDAGPGVPLAEREAVFDRFARLGAARRDHATGLGLGLPLAREIARRHGGDCWLEDAPGGGCRAVLSIFQSSAHTG